MTTSANAGIVRRKGVGAKVGRIVLFTVLGLFCVYYLMPLWVVVVTSLKALDEIRAGSLLGLPQAPSFAAWGKAWSSACVGVRQTAAKYSSRIISWSDALAFSSRRNRLFSFFNLS